MKYCTECGAKLTIKECFNCGISEGMVPYCPVCGEFRFPWFNVAASVVIFNRDCSKTLFIQQYGKGKNILVAGYVNKAETLEEALIREIKEEVGLCVEKFIFNESKYFEKSNSLICNFIAVSCDETLKCNAEVDFAMWYQIDNAKEAILKDSLAEYFFKKALLKKDCFAIY